MKKLWIISVLLAVSVSAHCQEQTLANADWFHREIADGVVWRYYWFDNLFGSPQSISYIEANLDNPAVSIEFPYLQTGLQKTSSMIPSQVPGAKAGINGTYFNTSSSGGHRTYLRLNHVEIPPHPPLFSAWGYEGSLALDSSGDASIQRIPAGGWAGDTLHPDIMACGPLLIIDSRIQSSAFSSIGSHCTGRHPRSAVGITADRHLILLTVDGRTEWASGMTCEELAQTMGQLGCPDALNLDGGGSTTLWGGGAEQSFFNGVLNYPSDNGAYDHKGERSCANAIALVAPATGPAPWDGRLVSIAYSSSMKTGDAQTVSLTYKNTGSKWWTPAETKLALARPGSRTSGFYHSATWPNLSQPAVLSAPVAPGNTGTFTFTLKAPFVETTTTFDEYFMLTRSGIGRIGPADNEAWMRIQVAPMQPMIVESREGGQNHAWYSDSGMTDTSYNCIAPGLSGNIGMRSGSTWRSADGIKSATVAPDFPLSGQYRVFVAWGPGTNRRNPITYHVNHSHGTTTFQIDQTVGTNSWVQLGKSAFQFGEGLRGSIVMTNEAIDSAGSMYMAAVKFEIVQPQTIHLWSAY